MPFITISLPHGPQARRFSSFSVICTFLVLSPHKISREPPPLPNGPAYHRPDVIVGNLPVLTGGYLLMSILNASLAGLFKEFSVQNPYHATYVSSGILTSDLFRSKLQALLLKKAPSWDSAMLSHVNLVLQDRGVLSPSLSENEDSPPPTPAPKRLKSNAIKPPAKHAIVDKTGVHWG